MLYYYVKHHSPFLCAQRVLRILYDFTYCRLQLQQSCIRKRELVPANAPAKTCLPSTFDWRTLYLSRRPLPLCPAIIQFQCSPRRHWVFGLRYSSTAPLRLLVPPLSAPYLRLGRGLWGTSGGSDPWLPHNKRAIFRATLPHSTNTLTNKNVC